MGLKSVSISSNKGKTKGKLALDIKVRSGKKLSRITELPAAKTSLQKISKISTGSRTPPQVPETSQVCKHLFYTHSWNIRGRIQYHPANIFMTSYRSPLIACMSKARLHWRTFVQKTNDASQTWLKSWQSTSSFYTRLLTFCGSNMISWSTNRALTLKSVDLY